MRPRTPWLEAMGWLCLLGGYFCGAYGICNWITAQRTDVGTWFFDWEQYLPLVPPLLVPYMSIDLFFTGSMFLCRDGRERHTLAARILFAISLSAVCFLLFPLCYGFPRPEIDGMWGAWFRALHAFDLPYNLAPSLHISLRTILWTVYGRPVAGARRRVLKLWFFFMGASTVFVYQHHFIDVIAGHAVAVFTLYLLPDVAPERCPGKPLVHLPLGAGYAVGAALVAAGSLALGPGGLWLLWPALALGLAAAAYLGLGGVVFQKYGGRLSWPARVLFLPWRAAAWVWRLPYVKPSGAWAEVPGNVVFGRKLSDREAFELQKLGVCAVLDVAAESSETAALLNVKYRSVPMLDLVVPGRESLREAVTFLKTEACRGKVYVHCAVGYTRSALVAAAFLLAEGFARSPEEAIAIVRRARPGVRLDGKFLAAVRAFQAEVGGRELGSLPNGNESTFNRSDRAARGGRERSLDRFPAGCAAADLLCQSHQSSGCAGLVGGPADGAASAHTAGGGG